MPTAVGRRLPEPQIEEQPSTKFKNSQTDTQMQKQVNNIHKYTLPQTYKEIMFYNSTSTQNGKTEYNMQNQKTFFLFR